MIVCHSSYNRILGGGDNDDTRMRLLALAEEITTSPQLVVVEVGFLAQGHCVRLTNFLFLIQCLVLKETCYHD